MMKKFLAAFLICSGIGSILYFTLDMTPKEARICAFCQESVIDSQVFFRKARAMGITTYKPAVPGHVLIIPERHVERFEDLTADELAEMGDIIKKVDAAVRKIHGTTGYLLIQKNGRESGQSVPHVHFHYLPCKMGDSQAYLAFRFLISPWLGSLSKEEMLPEIEALNREIQKREPALLPL